MTVWLIVCVLVIAWRVFDYPRAKTAARHKSLGYVYDFDYALMSCFMSFFWPIAIPLYGILKLGEWNVARKNKA